MKRFATSIDMRGNPILNLRAENVAALPAAGVVGRLVYLTTDGMIYRDTGAAWVTEVENGSSANGIYYKYPDGRLECFHGIDLGSVTANGAGTFSSPYYTNGFNWTFPHEFFAAPSVDLTPEVPAGVSLVQRFLSANYFSRNTTTLFGIRAYRDNDNSTADSVTVLLRAWGRWKA